MRENRREALRGWSVLSVFIALAGLVIFAGCRPSRPGRGIPEVGSQLPNLLQGVRMRNAPVGAAAPGKGWVVYAFSPRSAASEADVGTVESLARSLPPDWGWLAMAVEDEGLPEFLERLHVTVPVLTQIPPETLAAYQVTPAPRTYVLDEEWKLLEAVEGPLKGEAAEKLADRFKVTVTPAAVPGSPDPAEKSLQDLPPNLCLDKRQRPYSRGAQADVLGLQFRCGPGGLWIPES